MTQKEISKAKAEYEKACKQLRDTCLMLERTPAWDKPATKQYVDGLFSKMLDAQDLYRKVSGRRI